MSSSDSKDMELLKRLFPVLGKQLRKGDCGKVGVIGGSPVYSGAPYFASITPMKMGADLSFVYCHPAAASVIKGYSPELIVFPSTDFASNRHSFERLDALVFGPGLGREPHSRDLLRDVLSFVRDQPKLCLVIDADGLFYLKDCLEELKRCGNNLIITPNHREFARLSEQVLPGQRANGYDLAAQTQQTAKIAAHLGVTIVRKGESDIIAAEPGKLRVCGAETSLRRCGGQGDILSGAIALCAFWTKRQAGAENYTTDHLLDGAEAASFFVRMASLNTFKEIGRSMNAADIIAHIPSTVRQIDEKPNN